MVLDPSISLISLSIFWIGLLYLNSKYRLSRFNILIYPLLFVARTERFRNAVDSLSPRWRKFLLVLSDIFLVISTATLFGLPVYLIYNLFTENSAFFTISPLRVYNVDTVVMIILSLAVAVGVHEMAHFIALRAVGSDIESVGIAIFAILPIFFVETKEENYQKMDVLARLRSLAAGSAANIILVILLIPLFISLPSIIGYAYQPTSGAVIISVERGSVAETVGLQEGEVIQQISTYNDLGTINATYQVERPSDLPILLAKPSGKNTVLLITDSKEYRVKVEQTEIGGKIGVVVYKVYRPTIQGFPVLLPYFLESTLLWLLNFNLTIGLVNLLIFPYSDGKKILEEILPELDQRFQKPLRIIMYTLSAISVAIIFFSIKI